MKNTIVTILTTLVISASAQKKVEIKASLLDGSVISGTSILSSITLTTEYGKLLFPVEKINTINIGIGKDKNISDKATSLLKVLNASDNEDTRKGAYDDIVKLGAKAMVAIEEYNSESVNYNYTGQYTNENLLSELRTNYMISDLTDVNDVVMFDNGYTIGGVYEFSKIDIKTEYGLLNIPKEKIKSMDIIYIDNSNGQLSFNLLANKHISGNSNGGWLKTGVMLKAGQRFTITASGEIVLASLSTTQKYKPSGLSTDATISMPSTTDAYNNYETSYPNYGNVIYKIGETDLEPKRAGAKFNGVAKTSGMLYLSIYETVFSTSNTGSYHVSVTK